MDDATNETAESSEEGSGDAINLKHKYDVLEKNYRRLLEVTTALTEALEHAIRGNPLELEKTLNHCIAIYPELFSLHIRKPSRRTNFRTAYNTSVSEDTADNGEGKVKKYNYLHNINRDDKSSSDRDSNQNKTSGRESRSPNTSDAESHSRKERSPGLSFVKLNDDNMIPPIFHESSFEVLKPNTTKVQDVGGYPLNNDVNIMSLHPKLRQNHRYSNYNSDNDSSVVVTPVTDQETPFFTPNTENYIVKHPESDTDISMKTRRSHTQDRQYKNYRKEEKQDSEKLFVDEVNKPLEIVVHGNKQQYKENDADFSIKIIPDSAATRRHSSNKNLNEESFNPNETHIIIKKNNQMSGNEIILNSSNDQISLNVTIAKLQSLTTGLQECCEMYQPATLGKTRTNTPQYYTDVNTPRVVFSDQEEPTKISLLNSYGTTDKPKIHDEAFDQIKDDYESIKYNLIHGSVKQKSLILQSLRLNLIHTLANERAVLLTSYIDNDIFNLEFDPNILKTLIPKEIINGWDLLLQQTIFKFLNTISSMWKGRDYLSGYDSVIICMLKYFHEKFSMKVPSEAICKDMLIATFHKLSTRVNPQSLLVNAGVSEKVLFSLLENRDSITPYRLRHTLGLLINLCISKHGRKQMEPLANEVLILLATLLSSKEMKIVSSAARLLYILMANEKYHKEANKMEMTKFVDEAMKVANKRIKLQLETLMSTIKSAKPHNHLSSADAEEIYLKNIEPEIDELEEEVEIGEPGIVTSQTELYKRYEAENSQKISSVFSQEEEVKNYLKNVEKESESDKLSHGEGHKFRKTINGKEVEDGQSNSDGITIETGNASEAGDTTAKDNGRHSAESKFSFLRGKGKKGKKRDSDTMSLLSSNYTLLKEALDNIIDDQTNYNIIPEIIDEDNEKTQTTKSITITQEKLSISTQKTGNIETIPQPIKIEKTETVSKIERPSSDSKEIHTQKSRKHSLFSKNGESTYDYEYCEETKQIQVPLQSDNIFSEARGTPLKGLLDLNRDSKTKPNTPLATDTTNASDVKRATSDTL